MKNKIKENNAITLIALVITIIILLILAGVTLALLVGENGILKNANLSAEETFKAQIKEEIELVMQEIQIEELSNERTFNMNTVVEKIPSKLNNIAIQRVDNQATGEYKDYEYTITEDYKVIIGNKIQGERPTISYTLNTEALGVTQVIITVNASVSDGTIVEITKPDGTIEENVDQVTYTVNKSGTYIFVAKSSRGKKASCIVNITNILPSAPIIEAVGIYPTVTEHGIENAKAKVSIIYENNQELVNTYSEDNGVTWKEYKGPFEPTVSIIKARSAYRVNPSIKIDSQKNVVPTDAVPPETYDGNLETKLAYSGKTERTYYAEIDPSAYGKKLRVQYTVVQQYYQGGLKFIFLNQNRETVTSTVCWTGGTFNTTIEIPNEACFLQVKILGTGSTSGAWYANSLSEMSIED